MKYYLSLKSTLHNYEVFIVIMDSPIFDCFFFTYWILWGFLSKTRSLKEDRYCVKNQANQILVDDILLSVNLFRNQLQNITNFLKAASLWVDVFLQ